MSLGGAAAPSGMGNDPAPSGDGGEQQHASHASGLQSEASGAGPPMALPTPEVLRGSGGGKWAKYGLAGENS